MLPNHYVVLGQLAALRFLDWVCENPGRVVALPTGKTPKFFIKLTRYYLENWIWEVKSGMLAKTGFCTGVRPRMDSLEFFQLDEFFPIHPAHERSFSVFG